MSFYEEVANVMTNRISRTRKFMNTDIEIAVVQGDEPTVKILDAIEEAFGEFDRIVKQFTRFNADSELSNLNRRSGEWTDVSPELFVLVKVMLEVAEQSDGAFDPTVIDFLERYGYGPQSSFSALEDPQLSESIALLAQQRPSWKDILLNETEQSIKLSANQRVDLGGLGKGYAIDQAFSKLQDLSSFMINAGGDVRCKGETELGSPWRLGLKHIGNQKIAEILVPNIAVACSGSWARQVKNFHHLISPATGLPANEWTTVYVTADTAILADAWATALFVGGKNLLPRLPKGMSALMLDKRNKAIMTSEFPEFGLGLIKNNYRISI